MSETAQHPSGPGGLESSPAGAFVQLQGLGCPTAEFNYLSHISIKNRYVYLMTPKVACTYILGVLDSVERTNLYYNWAPIINPHDREGSLLLMPDLLSLQDITDVFLSRNYTRFTFVRNPFTRLLSGYISHFVMAPSFIRDNFVVRYGLRSFENVTFNTFIECITSDDKPATMDVHWRSYEHLLHGGKVPVDFVGRFECLNADICQALGTVLPTSFRSGLQHLISRVTKRGVKTSADRLVGHFYTPDLVRRVERCYCFDFEKYGYQPTVDPLTSHLVSNLLQSGP